MLHGQCLLPVTGVRIERVAEVVMPPVGMRIWFYAGTQQRDAHDTPLRIVAILRVVDQAKAMLAVAEIGPTYRRNFELRIFPAIVACGGPLNGSIGNLVCRERSGSREIECR